MSNRVSWFDHLVWQAVLRCRTTSVGMNGCSAAPLSAILNHTHLKGRDDQTLHREAEKLFPAEVERDESHQVTVVPLVAQPEPVPTNGEHCILAFRQAATLTSHTQIHLHTHHTKHTHARAHTHTHTHTHTQTLLPSVSCSSWPFDVTPTVQPVSCPTQHIHQWDVTSGV